MKDFLISAKVTVSVYTKVQAETETEALRLATGRYPMYVHSDGNCSQDEFWMLDEIDGEPFDLEVENVKFLKKEVATVERSIEKIVWPENQTN